MSSAAGVTCRLSRAAACEVAFRHSALATSDALVVPHAVHHRDAPIQQVGASGRRRGVPHKPEARTLDRRSATPTRGSMAQVVKSVRLRSTRRVAHRVTEPARRANVRLSTMAQVSVTCMTAIRRRCSQSRRPKVKAHFGKCANIRNLRMENCISK